MNIKHEDSEFGKVRKMGAVIRLLIGGVHPGFWKLVHDSRKIRLNIPAHSNRIMTYGIDSRTDLVFIAENIARWEWKEDVASESAMNLLLAFEWVLNLDIKNVDWFIDSLSFKCPDFNDRNITLDPEQNHSTRVYEIFLRKKIKAGFIELSSKTPLQRETFQEMSESFLFLVLSARFELDHVTRGKLKELLRIWM
jgi:hypothetical protein